MLHHRQAIFKKNNNKAFQLCIVQVRQVTLKMGNNSPAGKNALPT